MPILCVLVSLIVLGTASASELQDPKWGLGLKIGQDFQLQSYSESNVPIISLRRFLGERNALLLEVGGRISDSDGATEFDQVYLEEDSLDAWSEDLSDRYSLMHIGAYWQHSWHRGSWILGTELGCSADWSRSVYEQVSYRGEPDRYSYSSFSRELALGMGGYLEWVAREWLRLQVAYRLRAGTQENNSDNHYTQQNFRKDWRRSESEGWFVDPLEFRFGIGLLF